MIDSDANKNIADMFTESLEEKLCVLKNKIKHKDLVNEKHLRNRLIHIEDILAAIEMCDSNLVMVNRKANLTNEEAHEKANDYFMLQIKYDFLLEKVLVFMDTLIISDNLEVHEISHKQNTKDDILITEQDEIIDNNEMDNSFLDNDMTYFETDDNDNDCKIKESEHVLNHENHMENSTIQRKTIKTDPEFNLEDFDEKLTKIKDPLMVLKTKYHGNVDHTNCTGETQMTNGTVNQTNSILIESNNRLNLDMDDLKMDAEKENEDKGNSNFEMDIDNRNEQFNFVGIDEDSFSKDIIDANIIESTVKGFQLKDIEYQKRPKTKMKCYNCGKCGKAYAQYKNAQIHINSCTPESKKRGKKAVCNICGLVLSDKSSRRRHMKIIHTQKPPPQCNDCDLQFSTSRILKRHRIDKHGEQTKILKTENVNCPVEGCTFTHNQLAFIKKHMTIFHSSTKETLQCTICPFQCYSRSGLRKHQRSVHTVFTGCDTNIITPAPTSMTKLECDIKEEEVNSITLKHVSVIKPL